MKTEIICALITAGGTVLAAIIAHFTARWTSKREVKKMKMQWDHDGDVARERAFSEMVAAVSKYIQSGWARHQREAVEKISAVQANECGELLDALDNLINSVLSEKTEAVAEQLSAVMRLRRRCPDGQKQ